VDTDFVNRAYGAPYAIEPDFDIAQALSNSLCQRIGKPITVYLTGAKCDHRATKGALAILRANIDGRAEPIVVRSGRSREPTGKACAIGLNHAIESMTTQIQTLLNHSSNYEQ